MESDWCYLFYDKISYDNDDGFYNHLYSNELTSPISVDDLLNDDYECYVSHIAFKKYHEVGISERYRLDESLCTSPLYQLEYYTKNVDGGKLIFMVVGVNGKILEDYITSDKEIPNVNFLARLCKFHSGYTEMKKTNCKIMFGNVQYNPIQPKFTLNHKDNIQSTSQCEELSQKISELENQLDFKDKLHEKNEKQLQKLHLIEVRRLQNDLSDTQNETKMLYTKNSELVENARQNEKQKDLQIHMIKRYVHDISLLKEKIANLEFEQTGMFEKITDLESKQTNLFDDEFDDKTNMKLNILVKLNKSNDLMELLASIIDEEYNLAILDTKEITTRMEIARNNLLALQPKFKCDDELTNTINLLENHINTYKQLMS